jgi:hypothetical protein
VNLCWKKNPAVTVLATLELQVSTRLENAEAGDDFAITIAARKLFDIVRALPDAAKVKLDTKDSQVVVSAGKSRFTLQPFPQPISGGRDRFISGMIRRKNPGGCCAGECHGVLTSAITQRLVLGGSSCASNDAC